MSQRIYITDFTPNQLVAGIFAVQNCQLGVTKTGKPYIKCLLADRTGRAPGRMWNASDELFASLPTDGFVHVEGQTQPYQGEMQIIIQAISRAEPTQQDLEHLLPRTKYDIETMFTEVKEILGSLHSAHLRRLAEAYLADAAIMSRFRQAPAAQNLHHAFLGGLLEHTLSLMRLAEAVVPLYPKVSRDIVLMGLFLHDLGKCAELSWATGFSYSDEGQLVGHIARGVVWLNDKARQLAAAGAPLPPQCLCVLEHIILSHHGVPEFGALKLPATPEAILIHMLDNIDAKMQMSLDATRPDKPAAADLGGNFTEKVWALGNVRMFRADPLADENPPADPKPKLVKKPVPELRLGGATGLKGGL